MANKSILALGLVLPPSSEATVLQSAVVAAIKTANEAGYHTHVHAIDTTDENNINAFSDLLKDRSWDGVLVGWGIRGNPNHTALFEKIVNLVVANQQPVPRFIFTLKPDELMDGLKRVFEDGL